MALPETDIARIKKWCDSIWSQHMWDQAKVEADIAPTHVTIVEVRPDWRGGPEPTRFPIARLRYTKTTGTWAIYWRDRNLKFHEYQRGSPRSTSNPCSTTFASARTRSSSDKCRRPGPCWWT